jgi:hypothetical protein
MQIEASYNRLKSLPDILLRDEGTHPQSARTGAKSLCYAHPIHPHRDFGRQLNR